MWCGSSASRYPALVAFLLTLAAVPLGAGPAGPDLEGAEGAVDAAAALVMNQSSIPGMMISVSAPAHGFMLARGYGYACLEEELPVDPRRSLFQLGSVTKVLTWQAVTRLADEGLLDPDRPVNGIPGLGLELPPPWGPAVTVRHLMEHTAGFEDMPVGIYAARPEELGSLLEFLKGGMPAIVREPGSLTVYSNYGAALAARVVEAVSGVPYAQYIGNAFFNPFGMDHSGFVTDAGEEVSGEQVTGYFHGPAGITERPPAWTRQIGAGGLYSTAEDMGLFMAGLIGSGERGQRGFWHADVGGREALIHTGDTLAFSSLLALFPEAGLGMCISYNRVDHDARYEILAALADRFLPVEASGKRWGAMPEGRFTGGYRNLRRSYTTPAALLSFGDILRVRRAGEEFLEIGGELYAPEAGAAETEGSGARFFPLEAGAGDPVRFIRNRRGRVTHLVMEGVPVRSFERTGPAGEPAVYTALLALSLLVLAALVVIQLDRGRLGYWIGDDLSGRFLRWTGMVCGASAVTAAALAAVSMIGAWRIVFGMPPALEAARRAAMAFALSAAAYLLLFLYRRALRRSRTAGIDGLLFLLPLPAMAGCFWFFSSWQLL